MNLFRKSLLGISAALALFSNTPVTAQNNPFNPDFAWCNNIGAIAVRGLTKWQCLQPSPTVGLFLRSTGTGSIPDWAAAGGGGGGTVTSVNATVPAFMSISGTPITTSGTLAFGFNNQAQNSVLAGPTSGSGAPSFRALVAGDLSALTLTGDVGGTPAATVITAQAVTNAKLATMAAGTVKANITGGTATPTDPTLTALLDTISNTRGAIMYRGASAWSPLTPGTAGNVLVTNGAGADPSWGTGSGGSGNGYKNRFINGDFALTSRVNYSTAGCIIGSIASVSYSSIDRYFCYATGTVGNLNPGSPQTPTGAMPFTDFGTVSSNTGNTKLVVGQRIESSEIYDLASTSVTVSVWLKCAAKTSVAFGSSSPTGGNKDNYSGTLTTPATGTFTGITSSWTQKTTTLTLPADAINGWQFYLDFGAIPTGTCDTTGWQLESGSSATAFDRVPQAVMQTRAQRYFQANAITWTAYANGTGQTWRLPVAFRTPIRTPINIYTPTYAYVTNFGDVNCTPSVVASFGIDQANSSMLECSPSTATQFQVGGDAIVDAEIY